MDAEEYQNLRNRLHALSDAELLSIVTVRQDEYRQEAVEIACEECRSRGITAKDIEQFPAVLAQTVRESMGFCEKCWNATTDESPGSTFTFNFLYGTRLHNEGDECPECGSVRASKWFWFLLPVSKLGTYRVIYKTRGILSKSWVGRKLKDA